MKVRDRERQNFETSNLGSNHTDGNKTNYNQSPCQVNNQAPTNKFTSNLNGPETGMGRTT